MSARKDQGRGAPGARPAGGSCSGTAEGIVEGASLLDAAEAARVHAYAPYSGYAVGAALETGRGRTYTGVNVENAAYGTTICAERVALVKAVSEGERVFTRIAVVSAGPLPLPCGACRQALAEFSPDLEVLVRGDDGTLCRRLSELLPDAFKLPPRRP